MEDFVGPLDLILHLLSKNKIEIQDIRISQLLDQYMAYLDERKRMDLDIASEFVAMAAHLMYIKTRMLLSIHDEEALSEMEQLIQSLEERRRSENYQKIKEAAALLRTRGETGRDIYVRMPERRQEDKSYRYTHEKKILSQRCAPSWNAVRKACPSGARD
jgi:segregation and condensation protein A